METEIVYLLRVSILNAVADQFGPTTFERAMRHVELANCDQMLVLGQWKEMIRLGYLEPLTGSEGKYIRLSAKGTAQRDFRPGSADPYIWGARAL